MIAIVTGEFTILILRKYGFKVYVILLGFYSSQFKVYINLPYINTQRQTTSLLEGYDVGPGARRLLSNYWRRLTMAARAGGYYGTAFSGERGVTQGDPLSPTLFNVVVDAVVRHCINTQRQTTAPFYL